ncbi:MAG: glycogen-binding domain-containing protein [Kiritimatiellae bacterium]|nr:glycogen-binding domain-containing protein [Kiritimatiellia bacterium]
MNKNKTSVKSAAAKPKAAAKTKAAAKAPATAKTAVKAASLQKPVKKTAKAAQKKANTVTFTYRADKGCEVFLAGTFNNWNGTAERMKDESGTGVYTAVLALAPGAYEYKFVIDGTWCADPECADWVQNSHGTLNSVKHVTE